MGPAESMPVTVRWYPFYRYPALSLWLIFLVLILAAGAYRNRQLWYVLIPVLAAHIFWLTFKTISGMSSSDAQIFAQIIIPLCFTMGILLVFAHGMGGRNRVVAFHLAAAVLAGGGVLSFFAYNFGGTEISKPSMMGFVFYGILSAAFLLSLTLAGFLCRDIFTRLRFAVWVLVWACLLTMIFTFVYGLYDFRPTELDDVVEVLGVGFMLGLCLSGMVLPFLILVLTNSFHRQRLYHCLGLASTPPDPNDGEPTA